VGVRHAYEQKRSYLGHFLGIFWAISRLLRSDYFSKFIEIYLDRVHPVVPPDKNYEGLVDGGDWHLVETICP